VRSNRGQKPVMPASHDPADETRRVPLPPDETGPVPVSLVRVEPRWFGVPPPLLLLGLAVFSFALAVALFVGGSWPFGLILLGLVALFAASFLEIARRRPSDAVVAARSWASSRLELLVARSSAVANEQRLRGDQAVIEAERRAALLRLGEAVQSDDGAAARAARERLAELDRADEVLRGRLAVRLNQADERVRRVRVSIERTAIVRPSDDDSHRPAA
jgi:hypothetical protein